ncbi:MAG: PEGA domain-containing protein, partial [Bradymonadaceae bacterium]
ESIISTYDQADQLDQEIIKRQRSIHVARLYRRAREAEKAGNYGDAMEYLRDATKLDPSFRDAAERLRKLEKLTRLRVGVVEGATIKIDDETVGTAPMRTWLEAGSHDVGVYLDGERVWNKTLEVGEGEAISLEPDLEDVAPPATGGSNGDETESGGSPESDSRDDKPSSSRETPSQTSDDREVDWKADNFELVPK